MTNEFAEKIEQEATLDRQDLSKQSYAAIIELIKGLRSTPEFIDAVLSRYFERSFRSGDPLTPSNYGVYFEKGDAGYSVYYNAYPLRFQDEVPRTPAHVSLVVDKFDTDPGISVHPRKIAGLSLTTSFIEDQKGEDTEFISGGVVIVDSIGVKYRDTKAAYAKVSEEFKELTSQIYL